MASRWIRFTLISLPFLFHAPAGAQEAGPLQQTKFTESAPGKVRDLGKLSAEQRAIFLSAQRGSDWLLRANQPTGRFIYGYLPALALPMEGDHFGRQAAAARTLAQAGKFFQDDRHLAIARQALLSLLLETTVDPKQPTIRMPAMPRAFVNHPGTAGLLVMAIHELPNPGADLLQPADQLCNFLAQQIRSDGSLQLADPAETDPKTILEAMQNASGPALGGIIYSHALRPAAWKLEVMKKAREVYLAHWRQNKNLPMAVGLTGPFTEALVQTRDRAFADAVFELNDWLCSLQYQNMDPRRKHWTGGFMPWSDGKALTTAPDVHSALPAESLGEACRAAKLLGDVARLERYRAALERCAPFLIRHQFTEAKSQHFADWFQKRIVGGFHASSQDGNLRLDYTQQAVAALVGYLRWAGDLEN